MKHEQFGLSEGDLSFLVDVVSPDSAEKDRLKQLIRRDESVRDSFIRNEKVFSRIMNEEEAFLRISPQLYFEILLRKTRSRLHDAGYTVERTGRNTIPVFDLKDVDEFLSRESVLAYLADMLASFTKIESYKISYPVRKGIWRTIRYSDLDIDSLMKYAQWTEEEQRFSIYKRIGDLCLFMVGIFPEYTIYSQRYALTGEPRPKIAGQARRSMAEYEKEGRKFYESAAEHPSAKDAGLADVFSLLHGHFNAAKKPLNFLSEHYLHYRRSRLFGMESH